MRIKDISAIPKTENNLSERELKTAVAYKWLTQGFNNLLGGDKLAQWLEQNRQLIEDIFADDNRVYIRTNTPQVNAQLAKFVIEKEIGDEIKWVKCNDTNHWWLLVWWDEM